MKRIVVAFVLSTLIATSAAAHPRDSCEDEMLAIEAQMEVIGYQSADIDKALAEFTENPTQYSFQMLGAYLSAFGEQLPEFNKAFGAYVLCTQE